MWARFRPKHTPMMETLADIAFAVMAAVGLAVGGRLVRLWVRRRQMPELVFGGATLSQVLAGVGTSLAPAVLPRDAVWAGSAVFLVLEAVGTVAIGLGSWLIFRRSEGRARAAAWALGAVVLALTLARLALSDPGQATATTPLGHGQHLALAQALTNLGVAAAYGWMAFEAVRYGLLMRRRLALGLDDPIVVHQFLLWGLASASVVLINLLVIAVVAGTGRAAETIAWAHAGVALLGLMGAAALWSAFFTPGFYRAWVATRSEASA